MGGHFKEQSYQMGLGMWHFCFCQDTSENSVLHLLCCQCSFEILTWATCCPTSCNWIWQEVKNDDKPTSCKHLQFFNERSTIRASSQQQEQYKDILHWQYVQNVFYNCSYVWNKNIMSATWVIMFSLLKSTIAASVLKSFWHYLLVYIWNKNTV